MTQANVVEQPPLKTNHNIRIVTLTTAERVLCMFGDIKDDSDEKKVVGYRMVYPYLLTIGEQIFWEQTNGDNSESTAT